MTEEQRKIIVDMADGLGAFVDKVDGAAHLRNAHLNLTAYLRENPVPTLAAPEAKPE